MELKLQQIFILLLFFGLAPNLSLSASTDNPVEVTVTGTNPSCPGAMDGTATATATGGWEPYIYEWSTGDTTQTITGLGPGTYTVTVTDIDLAFDIGEITLTEDSIIWETASNFETCIGSCDATPGVVSVSGGTPPYTFLWNDPTNNTEWFLENACAGDYEITITDANGCNTVATVTVEVSPEGVWIMTTKTDVTCAGAMDGTAYAGAMTGTPPFTYQWSDPAMQTDKEAVGLGPGKYFVTVTDVNGCTNIDSAIINEPPVLDIDLVVTDFDCQSGGTGSITANPSGGTPPYTYDWNTNETTKTITNLTTGTYTVMVTDANDCVAVAMAEITGANPDAGTLTIDADSVCLELGAATISATPGGDAEVPNGYEIVYVLTSGPGLVILQTNANPTFTVNDLGFYTIHTLVYDPQTLDLSIITPGVTTGFEVNGLLVQGGGDICASLDVTGASAEVYDCCEADAGTLTNVPDVCLYNGSATLEALPNGDAVVPAGYQVLYVLTSGAGLVIEAANPTPTFTVNDEGLFTIHTLVYDPSTLDLSIIVPDTTTGFDVNALLIQGGGLICAALDVTGAPFDVVGPDAGTLTADNDVACLENGQASLSATPNGDINIPAGYEQIFVLTSSAGLIIEQVNNQPEFTVTAPGLYTIHTLVYDPNTLDLTTIVFGVTTGFDVNGLLVQGGGDICASLDVTGAPVIVEAPDAGTISADTTPVCLDNGSALISATPDGNANIPAGYELIYVLTNGPGLVIVGTNSDPEFTVTTGGLYTIHPLVYNPATLDLGIVIPGVTTGFDVNGLLVQGGGDICASLDVTGAQIIVEDPDAGTLTADEDEVCLDNGQATISATPDGNATVPTGYEIGYVLTEGGSLVIQQVGLNPEFTVFAEGNYTIHTLVYDPNTLDLSIIQIGVTTGVEVNNLLVQGGGAICASLDVPGAPILVEECDVCIDVGDYVWYDFDGDGIQNGNLQGVPYIQVFLNTAGPDGQFGTADDVTEEITFTDNLGFYLFECVEPGDYQIVFNPFSVPDNYEFTLPNQGIDDELDSDADTLTGATAPFTIVDGQDDDLSFDAGLNIICIPLYDGGAIGYDQTICAGFFPDPIENIQTPGIGLADVEYLWMFTTIPGMPFDPSTWQIVPNSNTPSLQPGQLYQTTSFIRCARYEGCEEYTGESNIVVITVIPYDPNICGTPFLLMDVNSNAGVEGVELSWTMGEEGPTNVYYVQKSYDKTNFKDLGMVTLEESLGQKSYKYIDKAPREGKNYYRIRLEDANGALVYSDVKEVTYVAKKTLVFPNPFKDKITLDTRRLIDFPTSIELYDSKGVILQSMEFEANTRINVTFDLTGYPTGVYYLKLHYTDSRKEVFSVLKSEKGK